ncbi:MAG: hypothetical protein AAB393_09475, partial [Bacteroidota bacterium]
SASHVVVRIANRTKADTSVTGKLRQQQTGSELWCPCTGPGESAGCDPRTAYRYKRDTTHAPSEWKFPVGGVLPDEQVQLACSTLAPTGQAIGTHLFGSGGPDTVGQTLVWRRYFETDQFWYCNPSYKFIQKVYISLVLSPDTVVRFGTLDSNNVYPYYPSIRNDTVTAGRLKRFVDVEARIAYGDSILRNYSIRVEKPVLVDSGGHSHDSTRPLGTYRIPKVTGIGFDTVNTFFVRKTDSTGVLKFRFLASQFGGGERIKARTVSDTTKFDTLSLVTIVSSLVQLPTSNDYTLSGQTAAHPSNHWVNVEARDSLIAGAIAFRRARWNTQGERMRINDLSLRYGGGLDIQNGWVRDVQTQCRSFGHCSHREGLDVDIENLNRLSRLIEAFENRGWSFIDEGQLSGQSTRYPHFRFEQ